MYSDNFSGENFCEAHANTRWSKQEALTVGQAQFYLFTLVEVMLDALQFCVNDQIVHERGQSEIVSQLCADILVGGRRAEDFDNNDWLWNQQARLDLFACRYRPVHLVHRKLCGRLF